MLPGDGLLDLPMPRHIVQVRLALRLVSDDRRSLLQQRMGRLQDGLGTGIPPGPEYLVAGKVNAQRLLGVVQASTPGQVRQDGLHTLQRTGLIPLSQPEPGQPG